MRIIKSLVELSIDEENFPIFFWHKWAIVEEQLHNKKRLLCVDEEQNVVPFTIYTKKFFRKGDYLYVPLGKNGNRLSVEKEKGFIDEFHRFLEQENLVDAIFPPSHIVLFQSIPSKCSFYHIGLMVVDLSKDEEYILSKLNKENKKQIRKAEEHKVKIYNGIENLNDFYTSYMESAKYKGFNALTYSYFRNLTMLLGVNLYCCKAVCDEHLESAYLCVLDKKNIYPLYSGTSFTPQYKGSKKFLLWNLYMYAKKIGIKRYISGGYRYDLPNDDPLHNVHSFKLSMGAEIQDGYHFIKVINPIKYNLVMLALRVKSILLGRECGFVNLKGLDVKKSK